MSENENRSIEETVEELRKQIQEITEDAKEAAEEEGINQSKTDEIRNDATEMINRFIEMIKNTSRDVAQSEQFKATCNFIEEKSRLIVDETKIRFNELKEDPNLQKKVSDAKNVCVETYDKVVERIKEDIEKVKQNEEFMNKFNAVKDETVKITKQGVDAIKDGIDDFTSKPKVHEAIEKTKDVTIEVAEKTVDSLKAWLRPEKANEQKENLEITTEEETKKE